MLAAIDFDDQGGLTAGEISKIVADLQLADELVATQLAIAQNGPEDMFGFRLVAAQSAGARD